MLMQEQLTCTVEFWDVVKAHMQDQPFDIRCAQCGENLSYKATVQSDLDLDIQVHPCDCVKEA